MKLHLSVKENPLDGYINLHHDDIDNLPDALDDAEALEILVEDMINYVNVQDIEAFINAVLVKLRHSGVITMTGVDAYEASRAFYHGTLNIKEFNEMLFGDNDPTKSNALTLHDLIKFFEAMGLRIIQKT